MINIINFEDAIKLSGKRDRSLLIGNGFSAKYFSYENLLKESDIPSDEKLNGLFLALRTVDFESVIHALEGAAIVADAYKDNKKSDLFLSEINRIRLQLVHAIRKTHPAHREDIADQFETCRLFLNNFSKYFTLNYDLLLYWIQLDTRRYQDGFGLGQEDNGFRGPFKQEAYCNTYNIHGGLHLFQDQFGDVQKILMGSSGVIDAIANAITGQERLPLYVAEGTWQAKLFKINSIPYLRHCLDKLINTNGDIFIFGHSANDSDSHIYNSIFLSRAEHIYFGIFEPNESKLQEFDAKLSKFQRSNGSKIGIHSMIPEALPSGKLEPISHSRFPTWP